MLWCHKGGDDSCASQHVTKNYMQCITKNTQSLAAESHIVRRADPQSDGQQPTSNDNSELANEHSCNMPQEGRYTVQYLTDMPQPTLPPAACISVVNTESRQA